MATIMSFDLLIFALFIFSASAVLLGCLLPARWLPPIRHDKWLHFIAFSGMASLIKMIVKNPTELLVCFLGLLLSGLVIESLQHWVPGRKFCWYDMAANAAGVIVVAVFSFFPTELLA